MTRIRDASSDGAAVVGFLGHLLREIPGKILLIRDGARIHNCKEVKAFLSAGGAARLVRETAPYTAPNEIQTTAKTSDTTENRSRRWNKQERIQMIRK